MATFTGRVPDSFLANLNMTQPIVFTPNGDKLDRAWAPYLPFTNSIRDLHDLYDFAAGNLYLLVAVDAAVVCDRLSIPGWTTSLIADPDRIILMEHAESGAKIAISNQFFGRLGLEFMSLAWFVEHQTESVSHMWAEMRANRGPQVVVSEFGDWGAQMEAAPKLYPPKSDFPSAFSVASSSGDNSPQRLEYGERPPGVLSPTRRRSAPTVPPLSCFASAQPQADAMEVRIESGIRGLLTGHQRRLGSRAGLNLRPLSRPSVAGLGPARRGLPSLAL